eukprot:scaffold266930_cov19-Tisochrysis_lutea.AAC.2
MPVYCTIDTTGPSMNANVLRAKPPWKELMCVYCKDEAPLPIRASFQHTHSVIPSTNELATNENARHGASSCDLQMERAGVQGKNEGEFLYIFCGH